MYQDGVVVADIVLELADGLQEGLAFDVSYGAAYLYDGDPCFLPFLLVVEAAFDLVGNMGDYLDGSSAVIAPALLVEYGPIDFSCGYIGILIETFINESLVMSQIQVCLRTVVSHKDLPVLDGIHCSWIYIDVWIEFLHGHLVASGL